jgi:hypothetical protein
VPRNGEEKSLQGNGKAGKGTEKEIRGAGGKIREFV